MKINTKSLVPILAALLVGAGLFKVVHHFTKPAVVAPASQPQAQSVNVTVVSTSPTPLDGATITPVQPVSITFSEPIQNKDEFRSQIDPKIDYTVKLSDDKKTATITPDKPYGFDQQYTFSVSQDTKFDGGKKLDGGKSFGYRTIKYSGV